MKRKSLLIFIFFTSFIWSQNISYWQQQVDYTMEIDMDVNNYQFTGKQKLIYTNNSPDALHNVFYHLQLNAFQPGSEMDIRLQTIADPDRRMVNNSGTKEKPIYKSKIALLKPDEIGYQKIISLSQNGNPVKYEIIGTILKVTLNQPISSGKKAIFEMEFEAQVPLQIRRNGRNSEEGVALSMAQWYPKMAEYDFEGWHANTYIAREFHGVWGDFDVTIHIDKRYTVGGTGYLQNPQEVGHGYEDPSKKLNIPKGDKLTWHFKAPNVHDFTWAADPEYIHDKLTAENGVTLHFLYKNDPEIIENWKKLQPKTAEILAYFNKNIGDYPYKQYSVIQGGDGGMEYGMCTLITGKRSYGSLVGVTAHEFAHSWFQFILATNETKHAWMDEGFTDYYSDMAVNEVLQQNKENIHTGAYRSYFYLVNAGMEEPQTKQSDRYNMNFAYEIQAYSKGSIFLSQLGMIIGHENLDRTIKKYYEDFKFKHPTPNDFIRTAEKVSDLQLHWYLNYWTQTTATIDYGIRSVKDTEIVLGRIGEMPMPLDIAVTYADGTKENFNIPLRLMLGHKPTAAKVLKDWPWANPTYTFQTEKTIQSVEIDPLQVMADIEKSNNLFEVK